MSFESTIKRTEGRLRDATVVVRRVHNNNINFSYCIIQYRFIRFFFLCRRAEAAPAVVVIYSAGFRRKRFLPSVLRRWRCRRRSRWKRRSSSSSSSRVRNPSAASRCWSIATRCRTADRAEEKLRKLMDQLSSAKLLLSAPRVTDTVWTG